MGKATTFVTEGWALARFRYVQWQGQGVPGRLGVGYHGGAALAVGKRLSSTWTLAAQLKDHRRWELREVCRGEQPLLDIF